MAIPIYREGHGPEFRRFVTPAAIDDAELPPAFVTVSTFRSRDMADPSVGVIAYRGWRTVYSEAVRGPTVHEPETRNSIGGRGAYRTLPPTEEQIAAAVERARAVLE